MEAHVSGKRHRRAVRAAPCPAASTRRHARGAVRLGSQALERNRALVRLGRNVHDREEALGSGKGVQQEVAQLRHLVERHGRLANEHEVAREAAHVREAARRQKRAHDGHDGVVGVGHGHGDGHHGGRVGLGRRALLAQTLVARAEAREAPALARVGLHDLLAGAHLLDVAVERAQRGLHGREVTGAPLARHAHVGDERHVAGHRHEREAPVEHEQQDDGAHGLDGRLDDVGEAVVEGLGHRVDVVGEVAHDVAGACAVKEGQRQRLQVCEQVAADVEHDALRRAHHRLRVAERAQRPHGIDGRREHDARPESAHVRRREAVDDRLDHVGSRKLAQRAHARERAHGQQHEAGAAHVVEQPAHRAAKVRRLARAALRGEHRHHCSSPSETCVR